MPETRNSFKHCQMLLVLFYLLLFSNSSAAFESKKSFTFGVVPQHEVRHLIDTWTPIFDYLSEKSGHKFVFIASPDIPTFEKQLQEGVFDFAYANPFQFLQAFQSQGYKAILRDDSKKLQGIIVTKKTEKNSKLEELNGKKIAFPAPNALGATLMVRYELKKLHNIKVIPRYVRTHKSVYLQVATGRYLAGGGVKSTLLAQPIELRKKLRIIHYTSSVFSHPIIAHPRVRTNEIKNITDLFMSLSDSLHGKSILKNVNLNKLSMARHSDYSDLESMKLDTYMLHFKGGK